MENALYYDINWFKDDGDSKDLVLDEKKCILENETNHLEAGSTLYENGRVEMFVKEEEEDYLFEEDIKTNQFEAVNSLNEEGPVEIFVKEEKRDYLFKEDTNEITFGLKEVEDSRYSIEKDPLQVNNKDEIKKKIVENFVENKYAGGVLVTGCTTNESQSGYLKDDSSSSSNAESLKNDQILVRKTENYKCEYCEKKFSRLIFLNFHLRIHTDGKPYKCNLCEKSFAQKTCLRNHVQVSHTGDKLYKCHFCEKSFDKKSNLNYHLRVHTGEKPFKCKQCKKSFSFLCNLNSHLRVHSGEKPFKCQYCEKSFSQLISLNRHNLIHTGKNP